MVKGSKAKIVEKKPKEEWGSLATHLKGVQLRIDPGAKLDILRKTIDELCQLARKFVREKWDIEELKDEQVPQRKGIIEIAREHKGLRGLISEKDNFILTIIPKRTITWDRNLLKESVGDYLYPEVAKEKLNISIPIGFVNEKGTRIPEETITNVIEDALINLGISRENLQKIISQEVAVGVDEGVLNEILSRKPDIELLKGTKTVEITWTLKVDPPKRPEKLSPKRPKKIPPKRPEMIEEEIPPY